MYRDRGILTYLAFTLLVLNLEVVLQSSTSHIYWYVWSYRNEWMHAWYSHSFSPFLRFNAVCLPWHGCPWRLVLLGGWKASKCSVRIVGNSITSWPWWIKMLNNGVWEMMFAVLSTPALAAPVWSVLTGRAGKSLHANPPEPFEHLKRENWWKKAASIFYLANHVPGPWYMPPWSRWKTHKKDVYLLSHLLP